MASLTAFNTILKADLTLYLTFPRKSPWRMSPTRKMRVRKRLKAVDSVIETLAATGLMTHSLVGARSIQILWDFF